MSLPCPWPPTSLSSLTTLSPCIHELPRRSPTLRGLARHSSWPLASPAPRPGTSFHDLPRHSPAYHIASTACHVAPPAVHDLPAHSPAYHVASAAIRHLPRRSPAILGLPRRCPTSQVAP